MYEKILVPVDGSPTSMRGLDEAIKLAGLTGGQIRVFHAIDEFVYSAGIDGFGGAAAIGAGMIPEIRKGGERLLEEAKLRVEASGIKADTAMASTLDGRIADLTIAEAKACDADLIVLGTHGRRGVGRALMGSDAEQILRSATVPVLLVRAAEPPKA